MSDEEKKDEQAENEEKRKITFEYLKEDLEDALKNYDQQIMQHKAFQQQMNESIRRYQEAIDAEVRKRAESEAKVLEIQGAKEQTSVVYKMLSQPTNQA
jgi:hypothetical protein